MVKDPDLARQALEAIGDGEVEADQIPADLFDYIVGHDEVKYWLQKSLVSPEPVHILLAGPPATAKSLFLEALRDLPGAHTPWVGPAAGPG